MDSDPDLVGVSLWLIGTVGHFWLTNRWIGRFDLTVSSRDEHWFVSMLTGTGTLLLVLHVVASTIGLGLASVLLPLAMSHAVLAVLATRRPVTRRREAFVTRVLEGAAVIALTATVLAWLVPGAATLFVWGTDAASYHVPVAVNLALGASPLDLPTTQHLYPMASSTLAAWFLVPVGDPLLLDLVMIVPFLLTTASLAWLFRLVTGESGLAWCTWLTLAVFSTPLFRQASLMSADLLFAAAFAALVAQLLAMTLGTRRSRADVLLVGLASGLLIGTKTTGLMAAVFLLLLALAALMLRRRGLPRLSIGLIGLWSVAGLLAIGAGGIWLVRNWWLFGSPVAPYGVSLLGIDIFRGTSLQSDLHLSVLADLDADAEYPLAARASFYITEWLGPWYLLVVVPLALVPLDALVCWWRGRPGARSRLLILGAFVLTAVPAVWILIGAPWTSLEWTRGMALRYVLPWFLLLSFVAWVGFFPAGLPWYRRPVLAMTLGGAAAVASLLMMVPEHFTPPYPPAVSWPAVLGAVALWGTIGFGHLVWRHAALATVVAALIGGAAWITDHDVVVRREARAARATEAAQRSPTQELYAAVLRVEDALGRTCDRRRFFSLSRFDEPLAMQPVGYRNLVFYAAREVQATARAVEPMGPCDYIVSAPNMLETEKASALMQVLNPYGRTARLDDVGSFVLLGQR